MNRCNRKELGSNGLFHLADLRRCYSLLIGRHSNEKSAFPEGQQLRLTTAWGSSAISTHLWIPSGHLSWDYKTSVRYTQGCSGAGITLGSVPTEVQKDPQIQWARQKEYSQKSAGGLWNQGACTANHRLEQEATPETRAGDADFNKETR